MPRFSNIKLATGITRPLTKRRPMATFFPPSRGAPPSPGPPSGGPAMARLKGTKGNDSLSATDSADSISGFGGNDFLAGGNGTDTIVGGSGNDTVYGDGGDDWVEGGAGNDSLSGGSGQDNIVFREFGAANADTIGSFDAGWDRIQLDVAAFANIGASGRFTSGDARFYAAAGATGGHDADDRLVYNTSTGQLFYDADGNGAGAAQLIATFQGAPGITATDIN